MTVAMRNGIDYRKLISDFVIHGRRLGDHPRFHVREAREVPSLPVAQTVYVGERRFYIEPLGLFDLSAEKFPSSFGLDLDGYSQDLLQRCLTLIRQGEVGGLGQKTERALRDMLRIPPGGPLVDGFYSFDCSVVIQPSSFMSSTFPRNSLEF
jgi:hypothetical protein